MRFLASVMMLSLMSGCVSYSAARGSFTGVATPVVVHTVDHRTATLYLVVIDDGPEFRDRQGRGQRQNWPSKGMRTILVRNLKGDAYLRSVPSGGQTLRIDGMIFPCFIDVSGREITSSEENVALPNYGLLVKRIAVLSPVR